MTDAGIGSGRLLAATPSAVAESLVASGVAGSGVQLAIRVRGEVAADVVAGAGTWGPMSADHLHPAYCLLKPVLALGAAIAVMAAERSIDDPLDQSWPAAPPVLRGTTLRRVVEHRTGLARPTAIEWRLMPDDDRSAVLAVAQPGEGPAYSEVVGGLLLEAVVEHLTGLPVAEHLRRCVLAPLGLIGALVLDADEMGDTAAARRLCVPTTNHQSEHVPLLSELLPSQTGRSRPAFGGGASASAVAAFYDGIAQLLAKPPSTPLASAVHVLADSTGSAFDDPLVHNRLAFCGPFMVAMRRSGVSDDLPDDGFGHTGGMTLSVGLADPTSGVAIGLYANGIVLRSADVVDLRRWAIDSALAWARRG